MSKSISQADTVDVCDYGTDSAPPDGDIDEDGGLRDRVQVHATYVDAAGHSYPIYINQRGLAVIASRPLLRPQ